MSVTRIGISLEVDLLKDLDNIVADKRFPNRSRAIRYLINQYKVDKGIDDDIHVTGAIVLVYDHRISRLHTEVAGLIHEYNCMALSSQHIHIDENNCVETIAVSGTFKKVSKLGNKLTAIKGIRHGKLVVSTIE